jgi:hypothetical protein
VSEVSTPGEDVLQFEKLVPENWQPRMYMAVARMIKGSVPEISYKKNNEALL